MDNALNILEEKNIQLPENVKDVLTNCESLTVFNTTVELANASTNGRENDEFHVKYDIPGKGEHTDDLYKTGKRIIDACLSNATTEDYNEIVPMSYQYSFNQIEDYEQSYVYQDYDK